MQKFYTVAIKNSFSILLLALGTLIRIKGGFVLLILYLKELVHEVKISVIFSNEIANYIILSKSLSAKTAMWNSNYLGCFKELLLRMAGLIWWRWGILAHREAVSQEKACSPQTWSPLAGCGIRGFECCSSNSQNGVRTSSFLLCVSAYLLLRDCLGVRDGLNLDISLLPHRFLFPRLNFKERQNFWKIYTSGRVVSSLGGIRKEIRALRIITVYMGVRQSSSVCEKWSSFEQEQSKQIGW